MEICSFQKRQILGDKTYEPPLYEPFEDYILQSTKAMMFHILRFQTFQFVDWDLKG